MIGLKTASVAMRVLATLTVLFTAWSWMALDVAAGFAFDGQCSGVDADRVGTGARWLGGALSVAHVAILSAALWKLSDVFAECAQGRPLSQRMVRSFRAMAILAAIHSVTAPFFQAALSPMLTGNLSIKLSTNDLKIWIGVGVALIMARILQRARALHIENESFL